MASEQNDKTIEEILLSSLNPFTSAVVRDPWDEIVDVEEVNREASDAVFDAIETVRVQGTARMVLLLGDPGVGKTHLLSRMRSLAGERRFFFVAVPPVGDLSRIFCHILREVVICLMRKSPISSKSFLQELARKLALEAHHGISSDSSNVSLNAVLQYVSKLQPDMDMDFLQVFFLTLLDDKSHAAIKWLQGYQLADEELVALKVKQSIEGDSQAFRVLRSLLGLSDQPVLLSLDQVESTDIRFQEERGIQILFDALAQIYNQCQNVCIAILCQTQEWVSSIQTNVPAHAKQRIDVQSSLRGLSKSDVSTLVKRRMSPLWERGGVSPPSETYPFKPDFLDKAREEGGPNPRYLIKALSKRIDHMQKRGSVVEIDAKDETRPEAEAPTLDVDRLLEETAESFASEFDKEKESYPAPSRQEIAKGVLLEILRDAEKRARMIEGAKVVQVKSQLRRPSGSADLDVEVHLRADAHTQRIGFEINNAESANSVFHTLNRIKRRIDSGELDTGFLVRDADLKIAKTAKRSQELVSEIEQTGGGVIYLDSEGNRTLVACKRMLDAAASGDLSAESKVISRDETMEFVFRVIIPKFVILREAIARSRKGRGTSLFDSEATGRESPIPSETTLNQIMSFLKQRPVITDKKLASALELDLEQTRSAIRTLAEQNAVTIFHESADEVVVGRKP